MTKKLALLAIHLLVFQLVFGISPIFAAGDSTPPELKSIQLSPKEVSPGDTVVVSADIQDDLLMCFSNRKLLSTIHWVMKQYLEQSMDLSFTIKEVQNRSDSRE